MYYYLRLLAAKASTGNVPVEWVRASLSLPETCCSTYLVHTCPMNSSFVLSDNDIFVAPCCANSFNLESSLTWRLECHSVHTASLRNGALCPRRTGAFLQCSSCVYDPSPGPSGYVYIYTYIQIHIYIYVCVICIIIKTLTSNSKYIYIYIYAYVSSRCDTSI